MKIFQKIKNKKKKEMKSLKNRRLTIMASSGSGADSVEGSGSNQKSFTSAEDTAIILNSMLEYYDQHKSYPCLEDYAGMVDFVENWLHICNDQMHDPSYVSNRIETLRRKYFNSSETEDGEPKNSCPTDDLSDKLPQMVLDSGFSNQEMNTPGGGEANDNTGPSTKKRAHESLDGGEDPETKKTKKTQNDVADIELLKYMLGYYAENKAYPTDNTLNLWDFIKKCLPVYDDNPLNVYERIINLHLRYLISVKNEDGKPGSSSSTDDQEIFKLSTMLWGYRIDKFTLNPVLNRSSGGGDQDHVDKNPEDCFPKS